MLPSIWRDNSIFGENLFDDWFGFPTERDFRNIEKQLYGKNAAHVMKTDVSEHDDRFDAAAFGLVHLRQSRPEKDAAHAVRDKEYV